MFPPSSQSFKLAALHHNILLLQESVRMLCTNILIQKTLPPDFTE